MMLSILFAIIVTLLMVCVYSLLNGTQLRPTDEESEVTFNRYGGFFGCISLFFKGLARLLKGAGENGWFKAVGIGIIVGLIRHYIPKLTKGTLWIAPIALVVMVCLIFYLMHLWCKEGESITELLFFVALTVIFFLVTKSCAYATTALWSSAFWTSVVAIALPLVLLVLALGYYLIDAFYFRYRKGMEYGTQNQTATPEEIENAEKAAGICHAFGIFLIFLTTIILILILWKGIRWGNFNWPTRSNGSATTATEEPTTTVPEPTTLSDEERNKSYDEAVRAFIIVPAEVDQTDINNFYMKHSEALMSNTWPTEARARKDNSAALLGGKGLYGGVEFPVDVAFCRSADYTVDHEGGYTQDELDSILYWIEERLASGKLSDKEKQAIVDWVVERIARDPIYGHMWCQAFALLHSQSGKSVREMYPWLDEFLTNWDKGERLETWSCRYEGKDGLYVHPEYKPIGYAIATTFERLTVVKIAKPSAWHFRMEDLNDLPSKVTTVKATDKESLAAAVLAAYDKNLEVFKERLGLNVFDGRAEVIPPVKKVEPTTEPTTEVPTTEPTTEVPTTEPHTCPPTEPPTTEPPTTEPPTTEPPTTEPPTTEPPTTEPPTTEPPTTEPPTTEPPTTEPPTTEPPTTEPPTTEPPTTEPPTTEPPHTKDPSLGVTTEVEPPTDETGPGDHNTEPSLVPPSTAYPVPTTTAPEETLPVSTEGQEETTVPPTSVDSHEEEATEPVSVEPPVNITEPDNPTTGPISTEPGVPWGGPPD